jgi:hypothetical protein
MDDVIFLILFLLVGFSSIYLRYLSHKHLKEEYKKTIKPHSTIYLNNYKFEDKQGILLKNISNIIKYGGWIALGVIFFLMKSGKL